MDVVLVSDTHLVRGASWDEARRVLGFIADDIDRGPAPDLIVIAGDLFNAGSWPVERNAAADWLCRLAARAPVVLLYGNHDRHGDLDIFAHLATAHPITVYDRPAVHHFEGGAIAVLPWLDRVRPRATSGRYSAAEDEAAEEAALLEVLDRLGAELGAVEGIKLFAGHCMIRGASTSHGQPRRSSREFEISLEWLARIPAQVFVLGHVHLGQTMTIGSAPVIYNGSVYRTAFGEVETKRYTVIRVAPGGSVEVEYIATPATPMLLVDAVWKDGAFSVDVEQLQREAVGAAVRFRYNVRAEEQDAARRAAETIREVLGAQGATVKAEPCVEVAQRARAPEIARTRTLGEKLDVWMAATGVDTSARHVDAARALLRELEQTTTFEAIGCAGGGARWRRARIQGLGVYTDPVEIDIDALPGLVVAVLGENGHGKSTLLGCWPGALHGEIPTDEKPFDSLGEYVTGPDAILEVAVDVRGETWRLEHHVSRGKAFAIGPNGSAVNPNGKLTAFAAWARENLIPQSVHLQSLFAPQGSGGLIRMKPGARRDALLRALGLEGLKTLAEQARALLRKTRAKIETTRDALARAHEDLRALRTDGLDDARSRYCDAEAARDARRLERDAHRDLLARGEHERRRREELAERRRHLIASIENLVAKLQTAEHLLDDGIRIRAAVARDAANAASQIELTTRRKSETERVARLREEADRATEHAASAAAAADRAVGQLGQLDAVLAAAPSIALAEERLPELAARVADLARALAEAQQADEAETVAVAEKRTRRAEHLRGALGDVVAASRLSAAKRRATDAIVDDDATIVSIDSEAVDQSRARTRLRGIGAQLDAARIEHEEARRIAERRSEIDRASASRDELASIEARSRAEAAAFDEQRRAAERMLAELEHEVLQIDEDLGRISSARADDAVLVRQADDLARATATVEATTPRLAEDRAALIEIETAIAALHVLETYAPIKTFDDALRSADELVSAAAREVATLVEQQRRAEELRAAIATENAALDEMLVTEKGWLLLVDALGPKGIPLLEIDAIGPEMTALANARLHRRYGPRFTIQIETQRPNDDGDKMIDQVMIWVTDTKLAPPNNRRDARRFCGGESFFLGLAVSLALASIVCARAGVEAPTLVRDEAAAGVSVGNREIAMAMLRDAAADMGASKMLLVTHDMALAELADSALVIHEGGRIEILSPVVI